MKKRFEQKLFFFAEPSPGERSPLGHQHSPCRSTEAHIDFVEVGVAPEIEISSFCAVVLVQLPHIKFELITNMMV